MIEALYRASRPTPPSVSARRSGKLSLVYGIKPLHGNRGDSSQWSKQRQTLPQIRLALFGKGDGDQWKSILQCRWRMAINIEVNNQMLDIAPFEA